MAKIKVFETTRDVKKNVSKLVDQMDKFRVDVDQYLKLVSTAKDKVEQEVRALEEKRRMEELAIKAQEEQKLKEELAEKEKLQQEKDGSKEAAQEKEDKIIVDDKKETKKSSTEDDSHKVDKPTVKRQEEAKSDQRKTSIISGKTDSKSVKTDKAGKKRTFDDHKNRRGKPGDLVGKFMSQAPVASDKDKSEVTKSKDNRYSNEHNKGRRRKKKKNHWEDSNPNILRKRKPKKTKPSTPPPERKKAITMGEIITVKELSEKIGIPVADLIKKLMGLGVIATINNEVDYDTASLIASEYKIKLEKKAVKTYEEKLIDQDIEDKPENLKERPPIVTVMGHVDHGKTSLLDAIKDSHVTDQEAGGITQHLGAYTVNVDNKAICFVDTPGHEAFTSMRARGAQVTDIAILVVAADDGVMPQTIEAINHAQAAKVPIIVAINKMDRPTAEPERIKQQLTEYGLVVEEWGGDTIAVPVSAIKKEGIDNLLEMILLVAEVQGIKANAKRLARGTIIEAELDKGRGPVATILVQNGTLNTGDSIVAGTTYGRVRAMIDDKGNRIKNAGPSTPVEVLGLSAVPDAGDLMYAVEDDRLAKQVSGERKDKLKVQQSKMTSKTSLDELFSQIKAGEVKDLNLIIKADVQGSVEAVKQALEKLTNDEVRVRSIHGAVGAITESDVMLATASNAIIIGFNVRPTTNATELAAKESIDIRPYRIIYNAIEDIEAAMKGMLDPEYKEVVIGHASVRTTFKVSAAGTIAGCYVIDGKITRTAEARLVRDGVVVHEGKISSLKRFKDDAREVVSNYECGIMLENYNDIKEGDIIEAFVQEEIQR
ncbi:MAG TPA: translation initiation factor IF-2 [Bacillota bacterium]|nr:translation initiation factor IF-2 [Bacillota bacterium]